MTALISGEADIGFMGSEAVIYAYNQGAADHAVSFVAEWDARLEKIFNRGFWDGYYLGQRLGEWSGKYGSSATRVKQYVAKGVKWFSKLGVGEFLMEGHELCAGDEVIITGPTTGAVIVKVDELRVDGKPAERAVKGDSISFRVPGKIRPADRLFRWLPTGIEK